MYHLLSNDFFLAPTASTAMLARGAQPRDSCSCTEVGRTPTAGCSSRARLNRGGQGKRRDLHPSTCARGSGSAVRPGCLRGLDRARRHSAQGRAKGSPRASASAHSHAGIRLGRQRVPPPRFTAQLRGRRRVYRVVRAPTAALRHFQSPSPPWLRELVGLLAHAVLAAPPVSGNCAGYGS